MRGAGTRPADRNHCDTADDDVLAVPKAPAGQPLRRGHPRADVPRLLPLYSSGQLNLDQTITAEYALSDINQGYKDMYAGNNIRGIITHSH